MRFRTLVATVGSAALIAGGSLVALAPPASSGLGGVPVPFEEDGQYEVPEGVCQVSIAAWGGYGGDGLNGQGGQGGRIAATFSVTGGDVLDVSVGRAGNDSDAVDFPGQGGAGYGDGGDASGGGGGGSSAVVNTTIGEPLIVAGGGGGGGWLYEDLDTDGGDGGVGSLFDPADGGDGGDGDDGSGGTGGVETDPRDVVDGDGGDASIATRGAGGGGAGSAPGTGGGDRGGGGGGASGVNGDQVVGTTSDPDGIKSIQGFVLIVPGLPGEGCPSVLEVAKVVSGPSTTGFTVGVTCTTEVVDPKGVSAAGEETTLTASLPYDKTGAPVASGAPEGWEVADGVWVYSGDLANSTCTATETDTGGAESVSYGCAWTEGASDADAGSGCPGAASGPSAAPQSVTFQGDGDVGVLTVTNTFAAAVSPNFTG